MRRCLPALVIAALGAAFAVTPGAMAKTKVVYAGGPPPKASQAGNLKFPEGVNLNGFYRRTATIRVGDSVRWEFSRSVVHTVTFLEPGDTRPPLEQPDPAHPYAGFTDATGALMWFNGQPGITIPPQYAFPQGDRSTGGRSYRNSGLSAPAFESYTLAFTRKGTFSYLCLVHPGMDGKVKVVRKSARIPTARADRRARIAQYRRDVARATRLGDFEPTGNRVVAGHDAGPATWFRFFPENRTISAGETVRFSISSDSEIHTATFGPQPSPDLILATPQPAGPPLLQFNPFSFLPSDAPLPPYTGTNHGNGFFNTGIMDTNPQSPPPRSIDVTFTTPGSYLYECTIHPGMQATITVR